MSKGVAFEQTLRSIDRGMGPVRHVLVALTVALLVLGGVWSALAEVAIYEVSEDARIEVRGAAHRVDSTATGRIQSVVVSLGDVVEVGQPLVELDARALGLELEALRARIAALDAQLVPLRAAVALEDEALELEEQQGEATKAERLAMRKARQARARLDHQEAERAAVLRARGIVAEAEHERAEGLARVSSAEAEASRHGLRTQQWHDALSRLDRARRREDLLERLAVLEGQRAQASAEVAVREHQLSLLTVRAPIAGHVASLPDLTKGAHVEVGTELMSIVPQAPLQAVAYFDPQSAAGRIRPGQPAYLRLRGFPWLQYGTLQGTVARVASEPRERGMLVTFTVAPDQSAALPVEHGLAARIEVEVESTAPAIVVLRAAGQWLAGGRS